MIGSRGRYNFFNMRRVIKFYILSILLPRTDDPSSLWQRSRPLAGADFLSMRRVFVSYSQPIRFAREVRESRTFGVGPSQISRSLLQARRTVGFGDENVFSANQICQPICQTWLWACAEWQEVRESRNSGVGPSQRFTQRSRFLVLTQRSAASRDDSNNIAYLLWWREL